MFIIGTGIIFSPLNSSNNSLFCSLASNLLKANETAKIALAPSSLLFSDLSKLRIFLSSNVESTIQFKIHGSIILVIFSHAFKTPLPKNLFSSPSLNSNASYFPVEAPLGTEASPTLPLSSNIFTSTVGFPRESNISYALTLLIKNDILTSLD